MSVRSVSDREGVASQPAPTIDGLLRRATQATPGHAALTDAGATLDWATLARRVDGFAAQLVRLGAGRHDRVALWLPNGVLYVVAILAAARIGATVVHVNTRCGANEVGDLISRTRAMLLVTRADFAAVDFLRILGDVPIEQRASLKAVICEGAPAGSDLRLVAPEFDGSVSAGGARDDDALIYATGGTTAKPKLVVHKQASIADHAEAVMRRVGTDAPDAAYLIAVPFCGTFGNIALMSAIAGGAHIVTMAVFDGEEADRLIRAHTITHLVGDDRLLARLCDAADRNGGAYTTVRFAGVAGYRGDAREAFARAADMGLAPHGIYGSSEAQALCCIGLAEDKGFGLVIPTHADTDFRIEGGEDGELWLAGPSMFDRYLDNPDATAKARPDTFYRTGDRAVRAGQGFIFEGRLGDVLRLGGFLVGPTEIETFLETLPAVAAAQVVGIEIDHAPVAIAFVIPVEGHAHDEAALIAACRARLARYKVPTRILAIDAFPTSIGPNGPKISKAELRVVAQTAAPSPIS